MAAKKKRARKRPAAKRATRRKAPRRNPSTSRKIARRGARASKNLITALDLKRSFLDAGKQIGGMMVAQFAAKKFADGGGANDPDWTWKNYGFGIAGSFGAGIAAEMVKKGSGKEFLKGGLALVGYKLVTNELSQRSEFVAEYFGNTQTFRGTDGVDYMAGDSYQGDDGEVYLMGNDGEWYPNGMNGILAPASDLGGTLAPPTDLGAADAYAATFGPN